MGQFDLGERFVLIVHRNTFHGVKCGVCAINDPAKNRIFVIQMKLFCIGYEELRLVRVGAGVRQCGRTKIVSNTFNVDRNSSSKGFPHMLWPPFPEPEGSPVWVMNPLMLR
jgi:hypothetical protein